jgi:membrane protein DedA with SNARE-associated domain
MGWIVISKINELCYALQIGHIKQMDKLFIYLTDLSGGMAYLILFGILVACGLGFPLPEDIPLIAAGYLVWDGTISWIPAIAVTIGGVVVGDTLLFFLGAKLGVKFLKNPGVNRLYSPDKIKRTRAYFRKYGDKIIFIARFFAGFRAVVFFMAGTMHMKYRRFILLDTLAALISVPIWIAVGFGMGKLFGDQIDQIMKGVKEIKTAVTIVLALVVVVIVVKIFSKYRRTKKA